MGENFKFNQNKKCEYFPCHDVQDENKFNCMFCFCPLYMLKEECGGNYSYINGIKDCTNCKVPHSENGYAHIMSKMSKVIEIGSKRD